MTDLTLWGSWLLLLLLSTLCSTHMSTSCCWLQACAGLRSLACQRPLHLQLAAPLSLLLQEELLLTLQLQLVLPIQLLLTQGLLLLLLAHAHLLLLQSLCLDFGSLLLLLLQLRRLMLLAKQRRVVLQLLLLQQQALSLLLLCCGQLLLLQLALLLPKLGHLNSILLPLPRVSRGANYSLQISACGDCSAWGNCRAWWAGPRACGDDGSCMPGWGYGGRHPGLWRVRYTRVNLVSSLQDTDQHISTG